MLEVSHLSVFNIQNKEKIYLLNDICFSLNKGDCLGIIGKSGDGKSTLAKSLLNIFDSAVYLEQGTIKLNNEIIDSSFRGKKISLLFQNPNSYLNPLMKVGKQIDEMLIYHFKEDKKMAKIKAINLMREVGIEKADIVYNYYPHEISGGMQQKVCLCIALICNPEILILDECMSYLDDKSKNDTIKLLKELQVARRFTLIIISHNFNEIYSLCNKIAIMCKGKMVELGSKDEIISFPAHPYTIELLYDYLRYYENTPSYICPFEEKESENISSPVHITKTHFYRRKNNSFSLPITFDKLKEKIYEHIRNQQFKHLLQKEIQKN